jgi:hypothetical protein
VTWKAVLADGTTVSQSTALSPQGFFPLYAAPYRGKGLVLGWLDCSGTSPSGDVIWVKSTGAGGTSYLNGFTNRVEATGSSYSPMPRKRVISFFNGYGKIALIGGGLASPITNSFRLMDNNSILHMGPNPCKLAIVPGTGAFRGTLTPPGGAPITFTGMLLQEENLGAGFFLTSAGSGQVILQSPGE